MNKKFELAWINLITLISALFQFVYYFILPERIVSVININGIAVKYSDKKFLLILIFYTILITILYNLFLHKYRKHILHVRFFKWIMNGIILFLILNNWILIFFEFQTQMNIKKLIVYPLSILMVIFAFFVSNVTPNSHFGIRTRFTLNDDQVWRITHKIFSLLLVLDTVVFMISSFLNTKIFIIIILIVSFVTFLTPYLYSYFAFSDENE